jgi:predicted unusual protein kinase regulating ubiquinone biosynthesis (AarF/ABC1/UbiB family)
MLNFNLFDKIAVQILYVISTYNLLFVKLFQSLSSNNYFSDEISQLFRKNTNNVYYSDAAIDRETLSYVINKYNITLENEKPINSGMIAIVYKGRINNTNDDVIIKIKKKNIKNILEQSYIDFINIYNFLTFILKPFQCSNFLLLFKSLTQTKEYILDQINFENEIHNIKTTFSEMKNISNNIVIPTVLNDNDDIINTNFILMTYIDGINLYQLNECDKKPYLKILLEYCLPQPFLLTYVHSDLHPGNIIYMNVDGELKIGIIDFGMVIKSDTKNKKKMMGVFDYIYKDEIDANEDMLSLTNELLFSPPIDRNKLQSIDIENLNKILKDFFTCIKKGNLNETNCYNSLELVKKIIKRDCCLEKNTVHLLLSITMVNSSLNYLSNYDEKELEKSMEKVFNDLLN